MAINMRESLYMRFTLYTKLKFRWTETKHANKLTVEESWAQRPMPVIPGLRMQREEYDHKASLSYVLSSGTAWAAM